MSFTQTEFKKIKNVMAELEHQQHQYIFIDSDALTITIKNKAGAVIQFYTPEAAPTVAKFHRDEESLHRLDMGPRGSSKSSGMCAEPFFRLFTSAACKDGVKRARWLFARQTYGELRLTTIKTFEHWFGHPELSWSINNQPPIQARLKYFDGEYQNELEILFVSFDTPDAAKKALSFELTGAYFNEAAGIPLAAIDIVVGSIGRYPAASDRIKDLNYWAGIIYDTNSFADYHPFYERFVANPAPLHTIYLQPGGLIEYEPGKFRTNPNAENLKNLPQGYYEKMAHGKPLSFIRTQICNQFGAYEHEKPVHPEYDAQLHSVEDIEIDLVYPLDLYHDYGGTNATLVTQYIKGQLRAIAELIDVSDGLRKFQSVRVRNWLAEHAPDAVIGKSIGDPADNYSLENANNSAQIVTDALGIATRKAITNSIKPRIDAVDYFILKQLSNGERGLKVSRKGCPVLHAGLSAKYHLTLKKVAGEDKVVEVPLKDDWSHPCDCLQYGALEAKRIDKNLISVSEELEPVDWGNVL